MDPGSDTQVIYVYRDARGRDVFVNGLARVPADKRAIAKPLDLSHVSTNPELGRDLDHALESEWEQLVESQPCVRARDTADGGLLAIAWRDHPPLIVLGAALVVLLLLTPSMVRRYDAPKWGKVLAFAIPLLVVVGLFAAVARHTSETLADARSAAEACDPGALGRAADAPLAARLGLVERVRAVVEAADVQGERRAERRGVE